MNPEVEALLPEMCAHTNIETGEPVFLKRGQPGFYTAPPGTDVDAWNAEQGITSAQVKAMEFGSMFGFGLPGADPRNWEGAD